MGSCSRSSWGPTGTIARIAVRRLPIATISQLMGTTIARHAARRIRGILN